MNIAHFFLLVKNPTKNFEKKNKLNIEKNIFGEISEQKTRDITKSLWHGVQKC